MAGLIAIISIGSSSSSLRILDQRRHGFGLNLIWGHGCSGDGTPRGRARPFAATNPESQVMNFGSALHW